MTSGMLRTPLALAVEALWAFAAVALVVQLFGQDDGPAPSIFTIVAVVVASFLLARMLQPAIDHSESDTRPLGVSVSILTLVVVGHLTYADAPWDLGWLSDLVESPSAVIEPNGHVIAAMVAMGALWIRGVQRGSLPALDFDGVLLSVSAGFVAVVLAALSAPDVQGDVSWGALAFAYGITALVTLAIFNTSPRTELAAIASGWPLVFAALACIALAGALLVGAVDGDALDVLSPLLTPLEVAGGALRDYVLAPIFWLIAQPFRFLLWLLGLIAPENQEPREPRELPMEEDRPDQGDEPLWFRVLVAAGATLGAVAIALIALTLLWRAFRRYSQRRSIDPREAREDVEPASSLLDDLGNMLGTLGRRFRRGERAYNSVAIRRLYADVINAAEARGIERPPSATPSQFAPKLDAAFASRTPSEISDAFVESRYAERPVDDEHVRRLRDAWRATRAPE